MATRGFQSSDVLGATSVVASSLLQIAGSILPTLFGFDSAKEDKGSSSEFWEAVVINGVTFEYFADLEAFTATNYDEDQTGLSKGLYLSNNPDIDGGPSKVKYIDLLPYTEENFFPYTWINEYYKDFKSGPVSVATIPPDGNSTSLGNAPAGVFSTTAGVLYATLSSVTLGTVIALGGGLELYTSYNGNGGWWTMGVRATSTIPQSANGTIAVTTMSGDSGSFAGSYAQGSSSGADGVATNLMAWSVPDYLIPVNGAPQVFMTLNIILSLDEDAFTEFRKSGRDGLSYGKREKKS